MFRTPLLTLALALLALPAAAQIYEWRDASGRVIYSDRPPPGVETRVIRNAPKAPAPAAEDADGTAEAGDPDQATPPAGEAAPPTLAERELEFRKRRAEAAEAAAKEKEAQERDAERQRQCDTMSNQLRALESGQRISRFNAAGEREFLDDAARTTEIGRARAFIDEHCQN